jgi:tripartite-type tricarboxylate transporter receptor subunit TctC
MGLPPGAGTDAIGRTIFEHMKSSLGQPVVVENAPGAGGTVATARAARAAPDGYTLSLGNLGTHTVSPATYPNIQYHPLDHFEPVALLGTTTFWMVARKDFPAKDLKELIAWLKANPGKATAGMVGSGGIDQIAGTYFQRLTGTQFQFVPYRGGPPIVQDMVAGHVDMWGGGAIGALGQVRGGQLKAYAVLSDHRWFAAPDVPTTAEFGLHELTVPFLDGPVGPQGDPEGHHCEAQRRCAGRPIRCNYAPALAGPGRRTSAARIGDAGGVRRLPQPKSKWWPFIKAAGIKAQ